MKTLLGCCLVFVLHSAQAQHFFNPASDTIALTNSFGVWKILVPEKTLIESAQIVSPNLISVHDLRVQDIHDKPYLFFRGRHREHPEIGYTVMVSLQESGDGVWKAGQVYQACWGEACTECGFDEYWGCACERYDGSAEEVPASGSFCNHMIALGLGLGRVQ